MKRALVLAVLLSLAFTAVAEAANPHPALILTGDEIAAVRAHIAAGDEPWRSAWRTFFDGRVQPLADAHPTPRTGPARAGSNESALRRYFAPFARDGSRARNFALAYGFSGDLYWARRARTFLLAWARNNEPTFFADSPNANTGQLQAYGAFSFAYAYDLVYGTLADADRTTIETYFRRLARAQQSCLRPQLRAISITALDALERYEWTTTGGQRLRYRALDRTVGGNFTLFMQVSTLALAYDAQFATKLAWLFDPANPLRVQRALDCSLAPVNEGDGTLSAVPALNILKGYQEGRGGTLDYSTYNARLASVILEIGRALAAIGYPAPTVANERPRLAATWSYLARFFGPEALPSPNPRDHVNLEADLPRFALAYRDLGDERFLAVLDSGPRAFYYEPQLLGPVTLTHSLPPAVDAPAPAEAMRAARLVQ